MRRTHDSFYKNEKKGTVKQAFKQIGNLIESHGGSGLNIADIGCATGVMPNYLHSRFNCYLAVNINQIKLLTIRLVLLMIICVLLIIHKWKTGYTTHY